MSQTIIHRHGPHLHLPLALVLAVFALVIVGTAGLVIINQPNTTTTTPATTEGAATAAQFVGAPLPVTVTDRAAAMTYFKRNYNPNVQFVPAAVRSAGMGPAVTYAEPAAGLTYFKRNYSPNVQFVAAAQFGNGTPVVTFHKPTAGLTHYKRTYNPTR